MGEKPFLFSGPMVRAILDGTKTQTRRVIKPQPYDAPRMQADECAPGVWQIGVCAHMGVGDAWRCPYGAPGDRLYVRERFAPVDQMGHGCATRDAHFVVFADGAQLYRDGRYYPPLPHYEPGAFDGVRWKPSIHMPRWASRITLDVVSVRVERLQDISAADAIAEGIERHDDDGVTYYGPFQRGHADPVHEFCRLWDSINGKRPGCSWGANPWVWVVEFRRITT